MSDNFDIELEEEPEKSRTQLKKETHALYELADQLVRLTPNELKKISLETRLLEEITKAQGIKKFGGLKRQIQFISKLLRHVETTEIENALTRVNLTNQEDAQKLHHLENLRDELITSGDNAITQVLTSYPNADRQHLRQLIRQAKKERDQQELSNNQGKTNSSQKNTSRKLFRYLRELDDSVE